MSVPLASLLFVGLPLATLAVGQEEGPKLGLDARVFNFGKIIQGEKIEHRFPFRNDGDAPLLVRKVKASCGCTAALVNQREYGPGEQGEVEVVFDSTGRMGFQNLEVMLYTNDPNQRDRGTNVTIVKVQGHVTSLVQVMPPAVYFQNVLQGAEDTKRITILPTDEIGEVTLEALSIVPSRSFLTVGSRPYAQGKKSGIELTVTLTGQAPPGKLDEHIQVKLNLEEQQEVKVPILAMINPEIIAFPNRIPFYEVKRSEGASRLLVLERLRGEGLPLLAVEADEEYLSWEIEEVVPGTRTEIEFTVNKGAPAGLFQREVRVFLDHPQVPVLTGTVFGEVLSDVEVEPGGIVFTRETLEAGQEVGVVWLSGRRPPSLEPGAIADLSVEGVKGFQAVLQAGEGRVGVRLVAGEGGLEPGVVRGRIRLRVAPYDEWLTIPVYGQVGGPTDGG